MLEQEGWRNRQGLANVLAENVYPES